MNAKYITGFSPITMIGFEEIKEKQDVFVKHNAPDNGQFQRRLRSQGQVERSCHKK